MCDSPEMGKQTHIELQSPDRESLERLIANRNTPQKHVWRARIVLLSDDGCGTFEIMRRVGKAKPTVWRWQKRFAKEGVAGLTRDQTRLPGKAPLDAAIVGKVVELTQQPPPFEETHWTGRAMADAAGISVSSVQRIWRAYGLRPHLVKSFKLSNDPAFAEKLHDIVGLYMNPLCASSRRKMKMPDRLHGLPTPAKSSKRSTVGNKRWNQSTSKAAIRAGQSAAEIGPDEPARAAQKDTDARWTVKFPVAKPKPDGSVPAVDLAIPTFGHKNHVAIDRQHGLIRTWTVTDAARHDGAQLIGLIDKTNTAASVWADTSYRSKKNEAWLATNGLRSCLHRRKPQGRPMPRRTTLANAARSRSVRRSSTSSPDRRDPWAWSSEPSASPGQRRRSASPISSTACSVWSGSAREPRPDKRNARKRSPDNPADRRIRAINPWHPAQILGRQSSDP